MLFDVCSIIVRHRFIDLASSFMLSGTQCTVSRGYFHMQGVTFINSKRQTFLVCNFVKVRKITLSLFTTLLHSFYIQLNITDQKSQLFRVDESYPSHMKVTPIDGTGI